LILGLFLLQEAAAGAADTNVNLRTVSLSSSPWAAPDGGAGDSTDPVFSRNGTHVVFVSRAPNLTSAPDLHGWLDVYLRNLTNQTTMLVSVNAGGTEPGNGHSSSPAISADGRWVVFESTASDLVPNDTNRVSDVFVRDLVSGQTTLVSIDRGARTSGNAPSHSADISADGRYVLFLSGALNLVNNDANAGIDVFVRDLQTGVTVLVSADTRSAGVPPIQMGTADAAVMTPDGKYVVFAAENMQLVPQQTLVTRQIFVRNLETRRTTWIQSGTEGYNPTISADGRAVFFKTPASNTSSLWRFELATTNLFLISSNATGRTQIADDFTGPVVSDDGNRVLYEQANQVYVWTAATGASELVSQNPLTGEPGNKKSQSPVLSADGRAAVFISLATNLTADVAPDGFRIYFRNLETGLTKRVATRVNARADAGGDDGPLFALSPDGRSLAFSDRHQRSLSAGRYQLFNTEPGGDLQLISLRDPRLPSLTGDGETILSPHAITADNRFIAFTSVANDLVATPVNSVSQVYVHDALNQTNLLISRDRSGAPGNGMSFDPALSQDGRYVAFVSAGPNLGTVDTNYFRDIFVRDRITDTIELISVNSSGTGGGDRDSAAPRLSVTGQHVAFSSEANNLVTNDTHAGGADLFWRDLRKGITTILSPSVPGSFVASQRFVNPVFSADEQWLAFAATHDVYLYDLRRGVFTPVTPGTLVFNAQNPVVPVPLLSTNGQRLAFHCSRSNLVSGDPNVFPDVFVYDATNQTVILASVNYAGTASAIGLSSRRGSLLQGLSADGRFVLFQSDATNVVVHDQNRASDIFIRDLQTETTLLISVNRAGNATANGQSELAAMSSDARYVVFRSVATDLTAEITAGQTNVFLRDVWAGTTRLLSQNLAGPLGGSERSRAVTISADGALVLFQSAAPELVRGDFNETHDLFLLAQSVPAPSDADEDQLDDAWERQYFGDLSHSGAADSDGDGLPDAQEFRAATDPTDPESRLVLRVSQDGPRDPLVLSWPAGFGGHYQVQFTDDIIGPVWQNLDAGIMQFGSENFTTDPDFPTLATRYYRVLLLP
jgi:Tol biopolymer transport system component